MPRKICFTPEAYDQYNDWAMKDKRTFKRLVKLVINCQRDPFEGMGKPEQLKGDLKGFWSRRIDKAHLLVYKLEDDQIVVLSCKGHYDYK